MGAAYEACGEFLEDITWARRPEDVTAQVDRFVKIAGCLRDEGYDVDAPTVETFKTWATGFRVEFDWGNPDARTAYEQCSGPAQ